MPTKQELDSLLDMGLLTQEEYDTECSLLEGTSPLPPSHTDNDSLNSDTEDTGEGIIHIDAQEGDTGGEALSTSAHPLPIPIGSTFADFYKILSLLGRGGNGVVYKAQEVFSQKIWAIKVFWPHLRTQPYKEQHFRSGHMLVFNLNQKGIVQTEEFIDHNGILAVRMKLYDGVPLSQRLQSPVPLSNILIWLKSLCEVIDLLHQNGIAHCDIKPDNIIFFNQEPYLLDFGIAVDIRQGDCNVHPQLGTQAVMAPEQYDGIGIGAATDRYALGLLVFRTLTGCYPWEQGETHQQIKVRKQTNDLIPFPSLAPQEIEGLSNVLHKMLHANMTLRYRRCIDFFHDLERCWKRHSDPNFFEATERIDKGARIEPITYTQHPLQAKREQYIARFLQKKQIKEPELVQARQRIEEIIRALRAGITQDQTELRQLVQQHKIWNLSPLQRNPFSSKNGHAMYMRLVTDGCFVMGNSKTNPNATASEFPSYGVHIPEGFWIAETPITQALYQDIMGALPAIVRHPKHPVHCVSWHEAVNFCNAFSIQCGFQPVYSGAEWNRNANGFRLPTEAEWEYCALSSTNSTYSGNNRISSVGWCSSNSGSTAHPVGKKHANAWGLFDMSGNIEEWCWDYFAPYPQTEEHNLFLHYPMGPSRGEERVIRGGSYLLSSDEARCKSRGGSKPNEHWEGIGFRVVQSIR